MMSSGVVVGEGGSMVAVAVGWAASHRLAVNCSCVTPKALSGGVGAEGPDQHMQQGERIVIGNRGTKMMSTHTSTKPTCLCLFSVPFYALLFSPRE